MKKRTKDKPYRSLLVLVLAVFVLGVIPLALLSISVYQYSLSMLNLAVAETRNAEISYYADLLAEEIDTLRRQQFSVASSESARRLALFSSENATRSEELRLIRLVHSDLLSKASNSNLITSVSLYMPRYGYVVESSNYVTSYTEADIQRIRSFIKDAPGGIVYGQNDITLWIGYPFFLSPSYALSNTFVVTRLASEQIGAYLRGHSGHNSPYDLALWNVRDNTLLAATYSSGAYGYEDRRFIEAALREEGDGTNHTRFVLDGTQYMLVWAPVGDTDLVISQITPLAAAHQRLTAYQTPVVLIIVACLLLSSLGCLLLYAAIYRPIRRARKPLRQVEEGDLTARFMPTWSNELNALFAHFNQMVQKLNQYIAREYQFKLLASDAELKQLQYQISPHFLYNTYFILNGLLMQEDTEKAASLARLIGVYLQYIVRTKETYATLNAEMRHARAYAEIQQMRFETRIEVQFEEYPQACAEIRVPRLIIQPLIENAFAHGMRDVLSGGLVVIRCHVTDGASLDILVEDNGTSLSDETIELLSQSIRQSRQDMPGDSVALYNIHRRIQIAFGEAHGIDISRSSLGGLCAAVRIPLEVRNPLDMLIPPEVPHV